MNILILSPHRDDAAFSLAFSISSWLSAGHQVTVVNAFTLSLYAPYSDADSVHENDRRSYISAMRKREDQAFLKKMPRLEMIDLKLKDAPIRLRCESSSVCAMQMPISDSAIAKIRKALDELAGDDGESCLVLPLALGRHVDHRVAREAAIPLSVKFPCAFYEDLPYAMREGARTDLTELLESSKTLLQQRLRPVLCSSRETRPSGWKADIALLYSSQIDRPLAEAMASFSERYGGSERLWANDAWIKVAAAKRLSELSGESVEAQLPE
ncbi:hypothetical protein BH10ACI4_BH10ACI4_26780 [soil metagenome]